MQAPSLRKSEFFTIEMRHIPTSFQAVNRVKFEGWVTEFADQFTSQWTEEFVYGRMDPLSTFERTSRKIQLAFDIVSDNQEEAQRNLIKVNKLITFLYPVYTPDQNKGRIGNTLQAAPLIQMRWTNLISDSADGGFLTGYLGGVNYSPQIGDGGFVVGKSDARSAANVATAAFDRAMADYLREAGSRAQGDVFEGTADGPLAPPIQKGLTYVPKTLNISLDYTVLHTHLMGWTETNNVMSFGGGLGQQFPNANVIGSAPSANQGILTTDPETGAAATADAPGSDPIADSFLAGVLNPSGK